MRGHGLQLVRHLASIAIAILVWWPTAVHAFIFERTFSWDEEVLLSDGFTLLTRREITRASLCSPALPGSCAVRKSTLKTSIPALGTVQFDWTGIELPVSFDVIAGQPWIVMPISGLESCEKFGNPAESVAAFTWNNGKWTWRPYREVPRQLKLNLMRSLPRNDETRVTIEAKRKNRELGVELAKGFIPQHVKWEHSCHRINPPPDPEYERALRQFMDGEWLSLIGKVVETMEDPVAMTLQEDRALFGMPGDQHDIVGCSGKVSHRHSIFSTRKDGGATRGTLAAYRIALASEGTIPRSIFLPANVPTPRTYIARITCSDTLIYVVLRQESNTVGVLAYDVGGNRKNAWRIRIPDLVLPDRNWGHVVAFTDLGDRFRIVIGDYQHHGGTRSLTAATLRKRFVIDAPKR